MRSVDCVLGKYLEDNGLADVNVCPLCGYVGRFEGQDGAGAGRGICPECRSDGRSRMCGVQIKMIGAGRQIRQILCLDVHPSVKSMLDRIPGIDVRRVGSDQVGDTGRLAGEFQLAVCGDVLSRTLDVGGAISEICRVLADGGTAVFSAPSAVEAAGILEQLESEGFKAEVQTAGEICAAGMYRPMDVDPDDAVIVATSTSVPQGGRDHPIVSVIMPVYNASMFLREALDSILGQTLADIEVICVDDGSTDDSADIIAGYAAKDPRVKLVRQENGGAGRARNNGIAYARGDYVHYMDSDDWLELDAYEKASRRMASSGVDVCIFQSRTFDFGTGEMMPRVKTFRLDGHISDFDANPLYFVRNYVVPWDKLIRREVITGNGLLYDEISCANDRSFYFSLVKKAGSIMVCKDQLIYHRVNNPGSLVGVNRSINYDSHFVAFRSTMSYHADSDDAVKRMLMDVCMRDMLAFYDRALDEYKPRIYAQLHDFLQTVDFSMFRNGNGYKWWDTIQSIKHNPEPPHVAPEGDCGEVREPVSADVPVRGDVVVSLTSYPARIGTLHSVVESILGQTVRPGRILLWLSEEQFPGREDDLPEELLELRSRGLEIRFCDDDLKPHKKYFYAMQEFPDSAVITVDDDMAYPPDTVERLLESYRLFPGAVSAMRVIRITVDGGDLAPYSEWDYKDNSFYRNPSAKAMATGVGGVLYPPGIIPDAAFDSEAIKSTCLFGDDLWLKLHESEEGVPTVLAAPSRDLEFLEGTQETSLWYRNKNDSGNDVQIRRIQEWSSERTGFSMLEEVLASYLDAGTDVSFLWDCHGAECGRVKDFLGCMPAWGELVCYNVSEDDDLECLRGMWWDRRLTVLSSQGVRTPLFVAAASGRGRRMVVVDPSRYRYTGRFFAATRKAASKSDRIVADDRGMASALGVLGSDGRRSGAFDPCKTVFSRDVLTGGRFVHLRDDMSTCAAAAYGGLEVPDDAACLHIEPRLHNDLSLRSIAAGLASSRHGGRPPVEDILRIYDMLRMRPGMGECESEYGDGLGSYRRRVCPVCGIASDYMLPGKDRLYDGISCPSCGSLERHRAVELELKFTLDAARGAPKVLYLDYPGGMVKHLRRRGATCSRLADLAKAVGGFDAIVASHVLHKAKDMGGVLDALRSKLSSKGVLFVTLPLSTVGDRIHMVRELGIDAYEVMDAIREHGFDAELRWNKEHFSAETVELYSLGINAVIVCRVRDPARAREAGSVPAEQVARVHPAPVELPVVAVGHDDVRDPLELLEVGHRAQPRVGALLQGRLVHHDFEAHVPEDQRHVEYAGLPVVVRPGLHGQAVDAYRRALPGLLRDPLGDEPLPGGVRVDHGLDYVAWRALEVGHELLGVLGQAVAAVPEGRVVVPVADPRVQGHAAYDLRGVQPVQLREGVQLVEVRHAHGQVGVREELHGLRLRGAHHQHRHAVVLGAVRQGPAERLRPGAELLVLPRDPHDHAGRVQVVVERPALAEELRREDHPVEALGPLALGVPDGHRGLDDYGALRVQLRDLGDHGVHGPGVEPVRLRVVVGGRGYYRVVGARALGGVRGGAEVEPPGREGLADLPVHYGGPARVDRVHLGLDDVHRDDTVPPGEEGGEREAHVAGSDDAEFHANPLAPRGSAAPGRRRAMSVPGNIVLRAPTRSDTPPRIPLKAMSASSRGTMESGGLSAEAGPRGGASDGGAA